MTITPTITEKQVTITEKQVTGFNIHVTPEQLILITHLLGRAYVDDNMTSKLFDELATFLESKSAYQRSRDVDFIDSGDIHLKKNPSLAKLVEKITKV